MEDIFRLHASGLESPATHIALVTPSDDNDIEFVSRAISVTQGGLVTVTLLSGDKGQVYIEAGAPIAMRVRRVWETGTDAFGIHAMW